MIRLRYRLTVLAIGVAAGAAVARAGVARPDPATETAAWEAAARLQIDDALATLGPSTASGRGAQLATAALLLNRQPRTNAAVERAEALLRQLLASGSDPADPVVLPARYLAARIAHVHRATPDLEEAVRLYVSLRADADGTTLADLAASKLALALLYDPRHPRPSAETWAAAEALPASVARSVFRAQVHLILGRAHLYYTGPGEHALRHLGEAGRLGLANEGLRASVWVSIGEIARELGHIAVARSAYLGFLEEAGADPRRFAVQSRLDELSTEPELQRPAP